MIVDDESGWEDHWARLGEFLFLAPNVFLMPFVPIVVSFLIYVVKGKVARDYLLSRLIGIIDGVCIVFVLVVHRG